MVVENVLLSKTFFSMLLLFCYCRTVNATDCDPSDQVTCIQFPVKHRLLTDGIGYDVQRNFISTV